MKNILAFVAAGVLILGGVGWYLGWFKFQTEPTSDGHREVKIDVDGKKILQDVKSGEQKIEGILQQKDGKGQSVTPSGSGGSTSLPSSLSVGGGRFKVENGVIVNTGEQISTPVPIESK